MDLNRINTYLLNAEAEINSLKAGKKVSATRARQALLNVKKEADALRKEILDYTKGLTKKKVVALEPTPEPEPEPVVEAPEPVVEATPEKKPKKKAKKKQ